MKTYDRWQLTTPRSDGSSVLQVDDLCFFVRKPSFQLLGKPRTWQAICTLDTNRQKTIFDIDGLASWAVGIERVELWLWLHGFRPKKGT